MDIIGEMVPMINISLTYILNNLIRISIRSIHIKLYSKGTKFYFLIKILLEIYNLFLL